MKTWAEVENLLGQVPDTEVAQMVGKSKEAVRQQRVKRGIPVYRHYVNFTDDLRSALGTDSDEAVATRFGVPVTRIKLARRAAGIPLPERKSPLRQQMEAINWETDTRTDGEIAEALATCTSTVCRIRSEMGIPNARERGRKPARREEYVTLAHDDVDLTPYLCLFPHLTNGQLHQRTGISVQAFSQMKREMGIRPRTRAHIVDWVKVLPRLSAEQDAHIARDLGIPATLVYNVRRSLNLPAYQAGRPSMPERIAAEAGLPEEAVAEKHSVTVSYVRFIRKFYREEDR